MKIKRIHFSIFVLAAFLAGCALVRPTDPFAPIKSPTIIHPYSGHMTHHEVEGPLKSLTLEKAIQIALRRNPGLRASAFDAAAAHETLKEAAGRRLPQMEGRSFLTHNLNNQRLTMPRHNGEFAVFGRNFAGADLIMSLPLFTGGRLTNEISAADALWKSARHRMSRNKNELIFNVTNLFHNILAQKHVIKSLEFSKGALDEHYLKVDRLVKARKAARVDLLRIEVRIADIEQRLLQQRNVLLVQKRILSNILDMKNGSFPLLGGKLSAPRPGEAYDDYATFFDKSKKRRNDYLSAVSELKARAAQVDVARASRWPAVSLLASYGERWALEAEEVPAGANENANTGNIGVTLNVPIFTGGTLKARVDKEKARLAAAQERLRQLELKLKLEVETALLNISFAGKRARSTMKAIEQGRESLRIEQEKYNMGKSSITDVLDAQADLLATETNHYQALAEYNTALAQLELATGGRTK